MSRDRLSKDNVVATYPNLAAARRAIVTLGRAGTEADKVPLVGHLAEDAACGPDTRLRDLRAAGDVAKGAGVGAAAGLAGGPAGGRSGIHGSRGRPVLAAGVWSSAAAGAVAGGAVGGMVGGLASVDLSDDWELTYQSIRDGKALVAVHADREAEGDAVARILESTEPEEIARLDSRGRRVAGCLNSEVDLARGTIRPR